MICRYTLIATAVLALNACRQSPSALERPDQEHTTTPGADAQFQRTWGEITQITNAINARATQIIVQQKLTTQQPLPPAWIDIRNAPPSHPPGKEPYNVVFTDENGHLYWIHLSNCVPAPGTTYAFAATRHPRTRVTLVHPNTPLAHAQMSLTLLKLKNDQHERFLNDILKRENLH